MCESACVEDPNTAQHAAAANRAPRVSTSTSPCCAWCRLGRVSDLVSMSYIRSVALTAGAADASAGPAETASEDAGRKGQGGDTSLCVAFATPQQDAVVLVKVDASMQVRFPRCREALFH
jgi:hypothetical protein